jgi:TonB family protein
LFPQISLIFLATALAQAQPSSSEVDKSQLVFTSISGPVRDLVVYGPKPVYPAAALEQHVGGRGVYKLDLDNGIPYDVRIVHSTGHKILDDAAVETLRTWRFRPHRSVWVTIPVEFRVKSSSPIAKYPKGAKAIAIYAPKPDYPFEARSKHWVGHGLIILDMNVESGEVTAAHMEKSTGHQILDDAALDAFRRWHFQPGKCAPKVKIPINFTMTGANY